MKIIEANATAAPVFLAYREALPKGRGRGGGAVWDIGSFKFAGLILYPHVSLVPGQTWRGNKAKYKFVCNIHNYPYSARADVFLNLSMGCQCSKCNSDAQAAAAGIRRQPRMTPEDKLKIQTLRNEGKNYAEIGRIMGRSNTTIARECDPEYREKNRQAAAKWADENREQKKANRRRYQKFDHGQESSAAGNQKRRALEYHCIGEVELPDHPLADASGFVQYNNWEDIRNDKEAQLRYTYEGAEEDVKLRKKQQIGLEKISGERYSLEHLIPLSRGGIHHPSNFANRALTLNQQKKDKRLKADDELFCKRIFDIK